MPLETISPQSLSKRRKIWRDNPIRFLTEALDVAPGHVWSKMAEIAESVRDNPRTAVRAGHSVSKTFCAARLALWFLYCHNPATVITTSPTFRQVIEILWREIRQAHSNAKIPLGGRISRCKLDLQDEIGKKWYALGFAAKPDTVTLEATAFQGYHNDSVMVIFDEAAGIMPQLWKAAQHLLTSGFTRWLVIGNPTSPQGNFAECFQPESGWNQIAIAVKDTPNFITGQELIPGVAGRQYEQDLREKYGENSNEYRVRIMGELPDYGESTYFGKEMNAIMLNGQIGFYPYEPTAKVYTFWDIGHVHTVIWFVQFVRDHIRIIDFYYDSKGLGLPEHAAMLQRQPYVYAHHFAPWDVKGPNAKNIQTGKYLIDTAHELGIDFQVNEKYDLKDSIAAVRDLLYLCQFHQPKCEEGIEAMRSFRRQINNNLSTTDRPIYFEHPIRDWTEHVSSAFRVLAMTYRYELLVNNVRIGYPAPLRAVEDYSPADNYNPLTYSLTRYGPGHADMLEVGRKRI